MLVRRCLDDARARRRATCRQPRARPLTVERATMRQRQCLYAIRVVSVELVAYFAGTTPPLLMPRQRNQRVFEDAREAVRVFGDRCEVL